MSVLQKASILVLSDASTLMDHSIALVLKDSNCVMMETCVKILMNAWTMMLMIVDKVVCCAET
jgi:hypothetical protein